jgi:D-alanyl-lipoteichoic acid acyltransferase DltB (MBOAT superfamily)
VLFNSFGFIFGFLPIALVLAYGSGRLGPRLPRLVVTVLSLVFYAWWRPIYLVLLGGSIIFNYFVGGRIQTAFAQGRGGLMKAWLTLGILADLGLLGWFKYANFAVHNLNLLGLGIHLAHIVLPLAISFFTFQKIAYLIDSARGEAKKMSFLDFCLFASFFPQLISGPITHYKEVVPQFQSKLFGKLISRNLMVGLVIFAIGLFKKTVVADTLASFSDPLNVAAARGEHFSLISGWIAAITFTFQLYFDFSGYSDMAIGLGRMFGIKLPLNFHSPLRASSIIDYWRRWHMTLQRFILAYIFQPLSVPLTRLAAGWGLRPWPTFLLAVALPSFVTFEAVGIWHGAGWTYVFFGLMHAIYIGTNQAWLEWKSQRRRALRKLKKAAPEPGPARILAAHAATLIAVAFGNVMFRARSVPDAMRIWGGMSGLDARQISPADVALLGPGLIATVALGVVLVFFAPNTQQIMSGFDPAQNWKEWKMQAKPPISWRWKPSPAGLLFAAVTLFLGVIFLERGPAVFLYFNF